MTDARPSDIISLWNDDVIPARDVIAGALRCPFPLAQNPLAAQVQQRSEASLFNLFGDCPLARKLVKSAFGWFVASMYPTAGLRELTVAADYAAWAFSLQNDSDTPVSRRPAELAERFERFDATFYGARAGARADLATQALESIVDRISPMLTADQLEVFAQANRVYFAGLHWQATNRAAASVPHEEEYALLRPAASVVRPCLALIEPLERIVLTTAMRRHRTVMSMVRLAGRMVCWVDDVLSYEEESRLGGIHNLAIVYEVHRQLRSGAALTAAVRRHNADAAEFMHCATALPSFGFSSDGELRRYVKALESTMRAVLEMALRTGRLDVEQRPAMVG
jgi:hypothetical protein